MGHDVCNRISQYQARYGYRQSQPKCHEEDFTVGQFAEKFVIGFHGEIRIEKAEKNHLYERVEKDRNENNEYWYDKKIDSVETVRFFSFFHNYHNP
jgi:predicted nucleotide-binding protein (sugar kinase/HSP70/actin superfamily)